MYEIPFQDNEVIKLPPFDEFPHCEMCGSDTVQEVLYTTDNRRIVECNNCGLWFTSPRVEETAWTEYLKTDSERSSTRTFTENRLKYGVALHRNIKYTYPNWRIGREQRINRKIDEMEKHLGRKIKTLHDVGCGVGFFMQTAQNRGIQVTGNDLNWYACKVMTERLGLNVYNDVLPNLELGEGNYDVILMNDYIEHTYHPLADLNTAYGFLQTGGIIYIETFHIDCSKFELLKGHWSMLYWNHTFHFSTETLSRMVTKTGFNILAVSASYDSVLITMIAKKE